VDRHGACSRTGFAGGRDSSDETRGMLPSSRSLNAIHLRFSMTAISCLVNGGPEPCRQIQAFMKTR
jgi:hypothetical protein